MEKTEIELEPARIIKNAFNEEGIIRDSERLHAILRYVESCTYSPEKKIIFAIAGVRPEKEV